MKGLFKMTDVLKQLWQDDDGALIATEFLFIAVLLVIGLVVGLVYVRNAVTAKLSEFAQAVLFLDVSYRFPSLNGKFIGANSTNPLATVNGSFVFDNLTLHQTEFPGTTTVFRQDITDVPVTTPFAVFSPFAAVQ